VLNTTAADMDLGTGGVDFVVVRVAAGTDPGGVLLDDPSGGHIMKSRYTPLQLDVMCAEAQESEGHDVLTSADSVEGMPVVCCGLHSQLPLVAAAIKDRLPDARVAYAMSDAGALPLAFSESVAGCLEAGLIDSTITCGQAFGGHVETVTLHSGLLAARHVTAADIAIVALGPGVAGTGTPFGHGGVAQGEAVNAASAVGAAPVVALRISFADQRPRHLGLSHHSAIALSRVALAPAHVAVPALPREQAERLDEALERSGIWERHIRDDVSVAGLPDLRGVPARSMGRTPEQDPAFFAAAAAAGTLAAGLLESGRGGRQERVR